jgi:hypothetical protein
MLTKIIGTYLVLDGLFSWLLYKKQKILIMKRKIISLNPLNHKKVKVKKKGKIRIVRQDIAEHVPRFFRIVLGFTLIMTPLPI